MFAGRPNARHLIGPVIKLQGRKITMLLASAGVLILAGMFCLIPLHADKHQHFGEELSVELEVPYEQLVKIIQEVSEDSIIRGTSQYKGTTELDSAISAKAASGFETWKGQGIVLFKIRPNALAPEHFYQSNDQGTVAVRYIVEPAGANLSHVRIQAIFSPDDGHRLHPSDGAVENAEFAEISRKLQEQEEQGRKQGEEEIAKQRQVKEDELRVQLDRDRAKLNATIAKQQQLEKELQGLLKDRPARIRTASADLKAAPYNESSTLRLLSRDDNVTVVQQTQNWYRVQTAAREQGWVYRLMVDIPQ